MSTAEARNSRGFRTREYWILTLALFIFSLPMCFLLNLALSYWTHFFGTATYARNFREALIGATVIALLYPPLGQLSRKWDWTKRLRELFKL